MSNADANMGLPFPWLCFHHLDGNNPWGLGRQEPCTEKRIHPDSSPSHLRRGFWLGKTRRATSTICEAVDDVLFDSIVEGMQHDTDVFPVIPSEASEAGDP